MPTIKELADELEMTKQGVRKYLARLPENHIIRKDNKGVVQLSNESAEIIRELVLNKHNKVTGNKMVTIELPATEENKRVVTGNSVVTGEAVTGNKTNVTVTRNSEVTTLIAMLQKELDGKNAIIESQSRQLENANRSIQDLTDALKSSQISAQQAQTLHAGTLHRQLIEGGQETESKEYKDKTKQTTADDAGVSKKRTSFFSRLIKRK